jgi:hypothetical protein
MRDVQDQAASHPIRADGSRGKGVRAMAVVGFVAVVLLWVAFGAALVLRQESLDAAWTAFRTASLPVQVAEGVVLLPWVLGLAAWQASWVLWLRLLLIAGLAWASIYAFFPWRSR